MLKDRLPQRQSRSGIAALRVQDGEIACRGFIVGVSMQSPLIFGLRMYAVPIDLLEESELHVQLGVRLLFRVGSFGLAQQPHGTLSCRTIAARLAPDRSAQRSQKLMDERTRSPRHARAPRRLCCTRVSLVPITMVRP